MPTFHLGQPCIVEPVTFNAGDEYNPKKASGTITYIHPALRYVIVEVKMEGGSIRESFPPNKVQVREPKKR